MDFVGRNTRSATSGLRNKRRKHQQLRTLQAEDPDLSTLQAAATSTLLVDGTPADINLNGSQDCQDEALETLAPFARYRRKLPASTRHLHFSNANEASCFFRADVLPLSGEQTKKQLFTVQKKMVAKELRVIQKEKQDILHKSLQMFFKIHFMAD